MENVTYHGESCHLTVLWAVGNEAWLGFDVASGLFSRAVLDTVHLAFAIWGIFAWRKDETRPSE